MSGIVILYIGISMILLSVLLFVTCMIYQKTAGKKIREELIKEYEMAE